MFKTNLKIAWRSLVKDRQFSLLNVIGLSAGLACTLLIYLWVTDERSFDKFFLNDDRLYQLMEYHNNGGEIGVSDESSGLLSETVAQQFAEVEYASPLAPPGWFQQYTLSVDDQNIKASGQYAGKDYFNIFSFAILDGERGKALANKNSIAITDELATKLFGRTNDLIGKPVQVQHDKYFYVSAVFKKPPSNSSQQFDFALSFEYLKEIQDWVTHWGNLGPLNFVLLKKGTDVNLFNKKVAGVITANKGDTARKVFATRFSDVYLYNKLRDNAKNGGRIYFVRLFSLIALVILVIACINFMNLSTAKAATRMKEVGVKKVVGADRGQLIFQFIAEAILVTTLAMILALGIAWLMLPSFNGVTGKHIELHFNAVMALVLIGITLLTGLLAGSYPALYLSGFKPLAILKGKLDTSVAELASRKGLVVFQFTLSAILIVGVVTIYQQVQFIQRTNPGYNKSNVLRFDGDGNIHGREETTIAQLKNIPGVVNASFTFHNLVGHSYGDWGLNWAGKDPNRNVYFEGFGAGYNFVETLGMQLVDGRTFSKTYGADSAAIIINQTGANEMHLKNTVGTTVQLFGKNRQIIGVVKDFHFESLHEAVKPTYIFLQPGVTGSSFKMLVRIKPTDQKTTIAAIQQLYEKTNPGFPFTFNFLDQAYQKQYDTELRTSSLSKYFSGLAIIISCLGLFGLTAFTAQKRRKEIGIRKVIGASVADITGMLSKDFLKLVLLSLLIGFPVAWWLMNNWLQTFAYRIHITPLIFLSAAAFLLLITLITVTYQSAKAAVVNPIKSLRTE